MTFWIGSIEQGLIFAIMVLGVYITYKILDFPDLSVDGSFPLGAAVVATLIVKGWNPIAALVAAGAAGALAGLFTGFIHVHFKIRDLLAGILTMTALYSVNLRVMGKSNIHLFGQKHLFNSHVIFENSTFNSIFIIAVILLIIKLLLDFLLKTEFGFVLRALGDNEKLVVALGVNQKTLKIAGLMISNALVAISGGVLAQHQGFADVGMGTGIIVAGLASIILGEGLFKRLKRMNMTTIVLLGSIIYRLAISLALRFGFRATDLKLITALIVIAILAPKKGFKLFEKKEG